MNDQCIHSMSNLFFTLNELNESSIFATCSAGSIDKNAAYTINVEQFGSLLFFLVILQAYRNTIRNHLQGGL